MKERINIMCEKVKNNILENSEIMIKLMYAIMILTISFQSKYSFISSILSIYLISIYKVDKEDVHYKRVNIFRALSILFVLFSLCIEMTTLFLIQIIGYMFCLIFIKKKKIKVENKINNLWMWFFALFIFFIMEMLQYKPFKIITLFTTQQISSKLLLILSIIIIVLFINTISLFCDKEIAFFIVSELLFLLSIVNFFVLSFTGKTFAITDLIMANTALSVIGSYKLLMGQVTTLLISIVMIVIFHVLLIKCAEFKKEDLQKRIMKSIYSIIGLYAFFTLFMGEVNTLEFESADRYGYVLEFINSCKNDLKEPKNYDTYKNYSFETKKEKNNSISPNVIIVMNEAFSDLSVNGNIGTNKEPLGFTKKIMNESKSGYVYSSVWGNNTVSSEVECLTGIPTLFTTKGARIFQLYMNENIPSLAKVFDDYGYETYGIHPYDGEGYHRRTSWRVLGFENQLFIEDFMDPTLIRGYVSDKSNYEKIIEIDEKSEKPIFVFNVTMQNHGGYLENLELQDKLNETSMKNEELDNYLTLLNESDKALKELISYYEKSEEPTVIMFYGDHQPAISNFYEQINEKSENSFTIDNKANKYKIPYFIWSNYELSGKVPDEISINYLGGILLQLIGIKDPWFDLTTKVMENYPVTSMEIYKSKTGDFLSKQDFKEYINSIIPEKCSKEENLLKTYEALSYKFLINEK